MIQAKTRKSANLHKQHTTIKHIQCRGCGSVRHGSERSSKCPAWNKPCHKCGKKGHFSKVCKSESPEVANALHIIAHVTQDSSLASNEIAVSLKSQLGRAEIEANIPMFADTGASICVAGITILRKLGVKLWQLKPTSKRIVTATNNEIKCRGWFPAKLSVGGRTASEPIYVCDNLKRAYLSKSGCIGLGIVHEKFPNPLPNTALKNAATVDAIITPLSERNTCKPLQLPYPATDENIPLLKKFLLKTFASTAFNCDKSIPFPKMIGVPKAQIHLKPKAVPVALPTPNLVPHYWKKPVKKLLDEHVKRGIIAKTPIGIPTPWCFRMVITPKKSNSVQPKLRMTIDLQGLNSQCQREIHHVESPFRLASQIPANTYKTILDAVDGYQAVELDEESQLLTNFITPWGCYHYLRVPAGLVDSGDKYTSRYDSIINQIPRKVKCVDDTLLYDFSIEEAFYHAYDYLSLCASRGIVLNASKFEFCKQNVTFAGFEITSTGIKPANSTLKAIRDFPVPKSITDIRSWFGLVRQVAYAHSISSQLSPFRELLKHREGKKPRFLWNEQLQKAFEESKKHIISSVAEGIETFNPSLYTCLQCDWSRQGIGFLLLQKHCSCREVYPVEETVKQCCQAGWKLTFAGSRFVSDTESRYAPTEGEAMAVAWALKKSRMFTLGCPKLMVITDHKPLIGILNHRDLGSIQNPRIRRIKEHTLEYDFILRYCPGKLHLGADALSRHPVYHIQDSSFIIAELCEESIEATTFTAINNINELSEQHYPTAITIEKLELECLKDPEYVDLHGLVTNGFPEVRAQVPPHCKAYWTLANDGLLSTSGNIVLYKERLVIPKALRAPITRILHSAHQGCNGMLARANNSIYWPGMRKFIVSYQSNCRACLEMSPSQAREPLILTPIPERPFQTICTDIFQLNGHYYLIIVDRFSGFIHIYYSREAPCHKFLESKLRDVFARYGRPEQLDSDGGPQFVAEGFLNFLKVWGIRHRISSSYYPQSNGRAEVGVKSAKRMLQDNIGPNGTINNDKVACAVLQYHNTPLQDGAMSPSQLLFGRVLSDFLPANPAAYRLHPYWAEQVHKAQRARFSNHKRVERRYNFGTRQLKPLKHSQHVLVQEQRGRSRKWNRSGIVVECLPNRQYKVRLLDTGITTLRNRRFLKPIRSSTHQNIPHGIIQGPNVIPTELPAGEEMNSQQSPTNTTAPNEVQGQSSNYCQQPTTVSSPHSTVIDTHPTPGISLPQTLGDSLPSQQSTERTTREPLARRRLRPHNNPGLME